MNDDAIRSVLSPLRSHEGHPDVERLVADGRRARRDRQRRRSVGAVTAAALAAGVGLAALPAGEAPLTARSVLKAAAAAAADEPPERLTGIRYVKIDYRILLQPDGGTEADRFVFRRPLEYWVRRDGTGRNEFGPGGFTDLHGNPRPRPEGMPGSGGFRGEELRIGFQHTDVERLPTGVDVLQRELDSAVRRAFEENAGEPPRDEIVPQLIARRAIDLLAYASITREQRRALIELLARMPGSRAVSENEVEMLADGLLGLPIATRLRFDPETGALAEWSDRPGDEPYPEAQRVEQSYRFTVSRDVEAVGVRP